MFGFRYNARGAFRLLKWLHLNWSARSGITSITGRAGRLSVNSRRGITFDSPGPGSFTRPWKRRRS